jgi:hypothetical protein
MAVRISGVGRVTVSERRSMMAGNIFYLSVKDRCAGKMLGQKFTGLKLAMFQALLRHG